MLDLCCHVMQGLVKLELDLFCTVLCSSVLCSCVSCGLRFCLALSCHDMP